MHVVLAVLMLFGIAIGGAIWSGSVLSMLWGWLIVPTFGLPLLTLAQAIGVSLVCGYLAHPHIPTDQDTKKLINQAIMRPAVALLIGWIVKQWI